MSAQADRVRAAADYIERLGPHKGSTSPFPHLSPRQAVQQRLPCCAMGALWGFVEDPFSEGDVTEAVADFLGLPAVNAKARLAQWNDAPERTKEEVVDALRRFADTLDAQP